jgi:hypothetical protein
MPASLFGSASATSKKSKKDKDKKGKHKQKIFNLEAEKETMKSCIAEASVASINLLNALRLINRETERISTIKLRFSSLTPANFSVAKFCVMYVIVPR